MYNGPAIFNDAFVGAFIGPCLDMANLAGILTGNRGHYENRHRWSSSLWLFDIDSSWSRRTFRLRRLMAGIRRVKGAKRLGVRMGNWLTIEQARGWLREQSSEGLRAKRDRAILAILIGCGLRRAELVGLKAQDFQIREEHSVIAGLIGEESISERFRSRFG